VDGGQERARLLAGQGPLLVGNKGKHYQQFVRKKKLTSGDKNLDLKGCLKAKVPNLMGTGKVNLTKAAPYLKKSVILRAVRKWVL